MKKRIVIAATVAVVGGIGLMVSASLSSAQVEIDDAAIKALLAKSGYEVVEIDRDDGEIEVEARKDGKLWEVELDPKTGAFIEVELDDDDDHSKQETGEN